MKNYAFLSLLCVIVFSSNLSLKADGNILPGTGNSDPGALSLTSPVTISSSDGVLTITTESEELISVTIEGEEYLTGGHYFSIDLNHFLGEEVSVVIVTDRDTYNAEMIVE